MREALRALGKWILSVLAAAAARFPCPTFLVVDAIAVLMLDPVAALLFGWKTGRLPGELSEPFARLTPRSTRVILRRRRMSSFRNLVVFECASRFGAEGVRKLVDCQSFDRLPAPAILATVHCGPIGAFSGVVRNTERAVLIFRAAGAPPPPPHSVVSTGGADDQRALALHQGTVHLRRGGRVLMMLDPFTATRTATPFFDRSFLLARGPLVLAKWSGAPIIPVVARWRGCRVEIVTGDAVHGSDETRMAASLGRWLEGYVMENPSEIGDRILDFIA